MLVRCANVGAWTRAGAHSDGPGCRPQMLIAAATDERPFPHHPAGNAGRRAGDRAPERAHLRAGALRQDRLSHPRGGRAHPRAVVHRAGRHAAGRLGAAVADPDRRGQGAAARAADGRAAVPRPRHRPGADRARAGGGARPRATGWWCWSATSPITARPASSAIAKGQVTMPGRSIRRGCWSPSLSPGAFDGVAARSGRIGTAAKFILPALAAGPKLGAARFARDMRVTSHETSH